MAWARTVGWYGDPANADCFAGLVDRVGAIVTGRTTYEDCEGFEGGSPHPRAPMVVVSHRPKPSEFAGSDPTPRASLWVVPESCSA